MTHISTRVPLRAVVSVATRKNCVHLARCTQPTLKSQAAARETSAGVHP